MMLAEAARKMPDAISNVIVLDPTEGCPAARAGAEQIVANFKDKDAIRQLASRADVITYEIESGDSDALESISDEAEVNPSPGTLRIIQDKLLQKRFLRKNGIPVADFAPLSSPDALGGLLAEYGLPALLKARRDAYDGRGNYKIDRLEEAHDALSYFGDRPIFLERFVDFRIEISVIAARSTRGEITTFPAVENIHENGILKMTIAPGRIDERIAQRAEEISRKTMGVLKGAGAFGIEMFVTNDDTLLINEIAPRVHNSGHHTLQSSRTTQFEQHLRAVLGLEMGSTELLHPTVMCNILGPADFTGRYVPVSIEDEDVYLKMYGKHESRPGRKMGHFNVIADDRDAQIDPLIERARAVNEKVYLRPA